MNSSAILGRSAPFAFVAIWSTGFVVARWTATHASPQLFLLARMSLAGVLMAVAARVSHRPWPDRRGVAFHLLAGGLLNGVYLCASWWAVGRGMPAGIMALLGALQPLVVAIGSVLVLRETWSLRGWAGLGIGLAGVLMVLAPLLGSGFGTSLPASVVAVAVTAILALAAGTMVQAGKLARDGMMVASALQNCGGAFVAVGATLGAGAGRWDSSLQLWLGLAWSVGMLSIVALSLLVWMTRRQGATRVSVLLLLVPPVTAVETWLLFDERLSTLQLAGLVLALLGVLLARTRSGDELGMSGARRGYGQPPRGVQVP